MKSEEEELKYYPTSKRAAKVEIKEQPWYHPNWTRQQSEEYLAKTPPGAFVLRPAPGGDSHVLDVQAGPRVGHVLLSHVHLESSIYYKLPGTNHVFGHLYDLVRFCHYNSFNFKTINGDSDVSITLSVAMAKHADDINEKKKKKKEALEDKSTVEEKKFEELLAAQEAEASTVDQEEQARIWAAEAAAERAAVEQQMQAETALKARRQSEAMELAKSETRARLMAEKEQRRREEAIQEEEERTAEELRKIELEKLRTADEDEERAAKQAAAVAPEASKPELEYHKTSRHAAKIDLKEQPWYRVNVTRQHAQEYLANTPPGAFILRPSASGDSHVLDVQAGPRVGHVLVMHVEKDGIQYHTLPGTNHVFQHLYDLIRFCHYNPFNFKHINTEGTVSITLSLAMAKRAQQINQEKQNPPDAAVVVATSAVLYGNVPDPVTSPAVDPAEQARLWEAEAAAERAAIEEQARVERLEEQQRITDEEERQAAKQAISAAPAQDQEAVYHLTSRHAANIVVPEQPWYRTNVSRQQAEDYLSSTPPGAFILRLSGTGDSHVLDVQAGPRVGHVLVLHVEKDGIEYHPLPGTNHFFQHFYDLILFCHYNPFYFKNINTEGSVSITLSLAMAKRAQQINQFLQKKKKKAEREEVSSAPIVAASAVLYGNDQDQPAPAAEQSAADEEPAVDPAEQARLWEAEAAAERAAIEEQARVDAEQKAQALARAEALAAAEEQRRQEEEEQRRQKEEARQREEAQRREEAAAEQKRLEEARLLRLKWQEEEQEKRRMEEAARQAEEARVRKVQDEARKLEEKKKEEEYRRKVEEQKRKDEEAARLAQEQRRLADEERQRAEHAEQQQRLAFQAEQLKREEATRATAAIAASMQSVMVQLSGHGGRGAALMSTMTVKLIGRYAQTAPHIDVDVLALVDTSANADTVAELRCSAAALHQGVCASGASMRMFACGDAASEIELTDTSFAGDEDDWPALKVSTRDARAASMCDAAASVLQALLQQRLAGSDRSPRRIELVVLSAGRAGTMPEGWAATCASLVQSLAATGLFLQTTIATVADSGETGMALGLLGLSTVQGDPQVVLARTPAHLREHVAALAQRFGNPGFRVQLALQTPFSKEPILLEPMDVGNSSNMLQTSVDCAISGETIVSLNTEASKKLAKLPPNPNGFHLLAAGQKVGAVQWVKHDETLDRQQEFFHYSQVFYNRLLAWASDPQSSISVKSLVEERNALVLMCPAPASRKARDDFCYSWLIRRLDTAITLVEASVRNPSSQARLKLVSLALKSETHESALMARAGAEFESANESSSDSAAAAAAPAADEWISPVFTIPRKRLIIIVPKGDGTFLIHKSDGEAVHSPQEWLRGNRTSGASLDSASSAASASPSTGSSGAKRPWWSLGKKSSDKSLAESSDTDPVGTSGGLSSKPKTVAKFFSVEYPLSSPSDPGASATASPSKEEAKGSLRKKEKDSKKDKQDSKKDVQSSAPPFPARTTRNPLVTDADSPETSPTRTPAAAPTPVVVPAPVAVPPPADAPAKQQKPSKSSKTAAAAAEPDQKQKRGIKSFLSNFNTVARRKIKRKEPLYFRNVERTTTFAASSEFFSVVRGESLAVLQELPDGTVVVRRDETEEEGLVPRIVFDPEN